MQRTCCSSHSDGSPWWEDSLSSIYLVDFSASLSCMDGARSKSATRATTDAGFNQSDMGLLSDRFSLSR